VIRLKSKNREKVVVGMSGGVDSSVAAAILKQKGYDVIGVTFKTWPKTECGTSFGRACCNLEAVTRARAVCEKLGIPYYVFDLSKEFKKEVIDYFSSQYLKGLTPNPCVLCNEKIKFGHLLRKARTFGAKLIATGHFAKVSPDKKAKRFILKEGKDKAKDQSYFLFSLSQAQIKDAVFPLGDITKSKARSIAKKLGLVTFNTVSSQDICFIRDLDYAEYIKKETGIEVRPGDIVDMSGKVVGRHKGIIHYTIGQRRGLGVAHSEPLYVTNLDVGHNKVIVGTKSDLMKKSIIVEKLNWISVTGIAKPLKVSVKIRYGHKKAKALVTKTGADTVRVDFEEPQSSPTPGQAAVFYQKDIVVGGGWIREIKIEN